MILTAENGRLPASARSVCDTGPNGPQTLREDAANVWRIMLSHGLPPGHLRSGYRTLAQQADEVRRADGGLTPSALPPGKSWHGEGIAADADEPARSWLWEHGTQFGVILNTVQREPWHVLINPALNTRTLLEDEFMSALTVEEQRRLLSNSDITAVTVQQIRNGVVTLLGRTSTPVDNVDEAAIAALVLASLTPEKIAEAIPDTIAQKVADELAKRLVK